MLWILAALADPTPVLRTVRLKGVGRPMPTVSFVIDGETLSADENGRVALPSVEGVRCLDPRFQVDSIDGAAIWLQAEEGWELVGSYSTLTSRANTEVVTVEEVRLASGTLGDPIRALANRPGMVRTPFDSGWLIVRGGDPDDTSLAFDGVRMPSVFHLGGFASVLPTHFVREVRFWPGTAPTRYGSALSGAVDVVPAATDVPPELVAGANLVFAHASTTVDTPLGRLTLGGRRSYLDAILTLALGAERARIAPRFWDVGLRLAGRRQSLTFFALGDGLDTPSSDDDEFVEIEQQSQQLQARIDRRVGDVEVRFTPWITRNTTGVDARSGRTSVSSWAPGARLEARSGAVTVGAESEVRHFTLKQGTLSRGSPTTQLEPYVDVRIGGPATLDLGYRLETLFVPGHLPRAGHSPRALMHWETGPITWHTGVSRTHAPPAPRLLIGLPDGAYLDLDRADSVELGLQGERGPWSGTLTGFARNLRVAGTERDGSVGMLQGNALGLESQLVLTTEQLVLRGVYQYTRTRRWEPGGDGAPTLWDQPHRLLFTGLWRLPRQITLAARARVSSAVPAPPYVIDAFDLLTNQTTRLDPSLGRLSPFASLDLKVSRTFTSRRWVLDASLDLQNLTNTRVFEPIIHGLQGEYLFYGKGLPFLPVFGVEAVIPTSSQRSSTQPRPG